MRFSSSARRTSCCARRALPLLLLGGVLGGLGCSSPDLNGPATTDPAQLVWTMSLNTHAILMSTVAPYDTLQLTAAPRTVSGAPLLGAPPVTFTASGDSSLRISSTGLLTARAIANLSYVVATVVYQGIRVSDTAWVNVTSEATPPTFQQLQLQLQPGDSAKMPLARGGVSNNYHFIGKPLVVGALDATQTNILSSVVALTVSDPLQAEIWDLIPSQGGSQYPIVETMYSPVVAVTPFTARVGVPFTVYASATVYGVTRQDSLQIVVTQQMVAIYDCAQTTLSGSGASVWGLNSTSSQHIGVGGYVRWANRGVREADSLDVVFDDSTAASQDFVAGADAVGGNIAAFNDRVLDFLGKYQSGGYRSRQFLRAGTFPWHSPRTGLSGTVVVQ